MLWVDSRLVSVEDLLSVDSEVKDIAEAESLVLTGDTSVINRGVDDAGSVLRRHLNLGELPANDISLRDVVQPFTGLGLARSYAGLAQLNLSGLSSHDWSPLKQYVVSKALQAIYRAAINRKDNDRYQVRWDNISKDITTQWLNLKEDGLPLVLSPLVCPGAILERAGIFDENNVVLQNGAGTYDGAVLVAVTWVGSGYVSPINNGNAESYNSAKVTLALETGKLLKVDITNLTPPDGNQPLWTVSNSRYQPMAATGWNVYVGTVVDRMYLQNTGGPIPVATKTYTLAGNPVLSGAQLGLGQYENLKFQIVNRIERA